MDGGWVWTWWSAGVLESISGRRKLLFVCVFRGRAVSGSRRCGRSRRSLGRSTGWPIGWPNSRSVVVMEAAGRTGSQSGMCSPEHPGWELMLVNAHHVKMVPGRKTDVADAMWLAELLEHGLLRGSFVPPRLIRELRDLTRYRKRLVQAHTSEGQRIAKILEDAGIKLDSVVSHLFGCLRSGDAAGVDRRRTRPRGSLPSWRGGGCAPRSPRWRPRWRAASPTTTRS